MACVVRSNKCASVALTAEKAHSNVHRKVSEHIVHCCFGAKRKDLLNIMKAVIMLLLTSMFSTYERISQAFTYLCYPLISCLTGTLLSPACCCSCWSACHIPKYHQHFHFSKQICVFLCFQWSLVVATITEIPPLVFLPNFLVQRKVLRPLRTQTGGTIMVGPWGNLTHTAEQKCFKTF